jgi:N-methylhydantoinase A
MNPRAIAGGTVAIDRQQAIRAIELELCPRLKLSVQETAYGIYQVANAAMMRAIRAVTTERGRDPREYALIAFGGAGPIHAADLAADLGMKRVYVPLFPGLFSALGLIMADLRYDYVQSIPGRLDAINVAELLEKYDALSRRVHDEVSREAIDPGTLKLERFLDLRYLRQMSEITIALSSGLAPAALIPALAESFHREHERRYGYRRHDETIAVVNLRLKALAPAGSVTFAQLAEAFMRSSGGSGLNKETRPAYFGPKIGTRGTRILPRTGLIGNSLEGPVVFEEFDTTVVVPPGWTASLDQYANITLDALQ